MTPVARLPLRMRGGFHRAGEIDAGNHRKTANDGRFAGDREPILVIHRRTFDAHGDIALHQIGFVEIGEADLLPAVTLLDHNCLECRHLSPPFIRAKAVPCGVGRRNSMSGCASVKLSFARGLLVRHRCRSRCSLTTMNAMTLDKWLPFRNEGSVVRCRLLCFPHAAGNATFYRPLRRFMPPEVDFCPVELPGRAARLHEPPFTSRSWSMYSSRSWKCHSVFLTTAWASAWPLRLPGNCARSRAATPCFCSFRPRESQIRFRRSPQARPPSDRDLLAILRRFGGTPAAVMQRPELIAALLPALRAGLALVTGYAVDPEDRITCPITAFAGADDVAHSGSLQSWRDFTRGNSLWRAFLLLSRGSRSRQGDHPGRACIRGHARARCEIVDMTHPCVDRPALAIGEIHVWTARLVDEHCATADLLRAQAAQFSFELARHGDWDCLRVQRSVSI